MLRKQAAGSAVASELVLWVSDAFLPLPFALLVGCANDVPTVTIVSPVGVEALYADLGVSVEATVSGEDHKLDELSVRRSSDTDGPLTGEGDIDSSGLVVRRLDLGGGLYVLTVEVEDAGGNLSSDAVARNDLLGHPVVVPRDMTVTELGIIAKRTTSNGRIALYREAAGVPTDRTTGSELQGINAGDSRLPVTPTRIAAGTYWLMAVYDSTAYIAEDDTRCTPSSWPSRQAFPSRRAA